MTRFSRMSLLLMASALTFFFSPSYADERGSEMPTEQPLTIQDDLLIVEGERKGNREERDELMDRGDVVDKACLRRALSHPTPKLTVVELSIICQSNPTQSDIERDSLSAFEIKRQDERNTEFDPFVITPHRLNYVLPALVTDSINREAYSAFSEFEEELADIEAKFQISLKVPLTFGDLFMEGDEIYFAFTIEAWWQVYAEGISRPFRETNYRPELFYITPLPWKLAGGNIMWGLGIEHQSNGQVQLFSRSWNRVYTSFIYDRDNWAFYAQPWWRIPENEKEFPLDPDGDDNPDIGEFMGYFEFGAAYDWKQFEFLVQGHRNFSTKKGGTRLGVTFPLWGKLRGFATVFEGYGESMIDYNHRQTRFGLGIALNEIL